MATKVMFSLPKEFLAEIDRLARQEHRTRSELIREALRLYLEVRQGYRYPGADPRVRQALAVQDGLSQMAPGSGEDSAEDLRAWREARR